MAEFGGDATSPPFLEELLEEQNSLHFSSPNKTGSESMDSVPYENLAEGNDEPMETSPSENEDSLVQTESRPSGSLAAEESSNSSDDVPLAQIARSAERLHIYETQLKEKKLETSTVDGAQSSTKQPDLTIQANNTRAFPIATQSHDSQPSPAEKPLTAFAYFFNDRQKSIRSANPMATFEQVSNIVQAMWKNLDFTTRQDYFNREKGVTGITVLSPKKSATSAVMKEETNAFVITPDPERPGVYNVALDPSSEEKLLKDGAAAAATSGVVSVAPPIRPRMKTTSAVGRGRGRGRGRPPGSTRAKKEAAEKAANENSEPAKKPAVKKTTRGRGRGRSRRILSAEKVDSPEAMPTPSPPPVVLCLHDGCDKVPVINKERGEDFCSSQCLVTYCSDEFKKWVESR